ncbi:MAG: SUMF1/EgtB/PvdO family nonheme iron enzyme [Planctomycetota bacterium]
MRLNKLIRGLLAAVLVTSAVTVRADVFNMGGTISGGTWTGNASLEFVTVGDAGNAADTATGYGAVDHPYSIAKYDTTAAQYTVFLNAVAKTDTYGLYNSSMGTANYGPYNCGISRTGLSGSYSYAPTRDGNYPVNKVSWGDAARFCNWLSNGQPTGLQDSTTTERGAYALNGAMSAADLMGVSAHSASASYFLPSENEQYKAMYYKSGGTNAGYWLYPTKSSDGLTLSNVLSSTGTNNANFYDYFNRGNGGYTDPTNCLTAVGSFAGSPGPYGTFDMGGDVFQWNETDMNDTGSWRGSRGGSFYYDGAGYLASSARFTNYPTNEKYNVGFRVASVPEPGSLTLLLSCAVAFGIWRIRRCKPLAIAPSRP